MIKPSFYFKVIVPAMIWLGLVTGAVLFGITDGLNRDAHTKIMAERLCPCISQSADGTAAELLSNQLCKGERK